MIWLLYFHLSYYIIRAPFFKWVWKEGLLTRVGYLPNASYSYRVEFSIPFAASGNNAVHRILWNTEFRTPVYTYVLTWLIYRIGGCGSTSTLSSPFHAMFWLPKLRFFMFSLLEPYDDDNDMRHASLHYEYTVLTNSFETLSSFLAEVVRYLNLSFKIRQKLLVF